jgi:glycine reductase complex component B subunit gamma
MPLRIALYLNQFFGQIGAEEAAGVGPSLVKEPVGPGRALAGLLQDGESFAGAVICGDNYFAENPEQAAKEVLELLSTLKPDLLLAGPAFNAGRYGTACGAVCQTAQDSLKLPAVTGMYEENPGVDLYHKDVLILRTGDNARQMRDTMSRMLDIGRKLAAGQKMGKPQDEGYFPQGKAVPEIASKRAATRATEMLIAKLTGQPYTTEVQLPTFQLPEPPAPIADIKQATIALITDGGLVPKGNPDRIEGRNSTKWGKYSVDGVEKLDPDAYEISHGGYDPRYVLADPHRLVGLDVARDLEREGAIGKLHPAFLSTGGVGTPVETSRRLGQEMASYLKEAGVDGVILTST